MSNTSDFILMKEDHTLGNLISEHLKQSPHVIMAGYKGKDRRARRRRHWFLALLYSRAPQWPTLTCLRS